MPSPATLTLSLGLGARGALQVVLFIGLARLMGPAELGTFTAVLAIMNILSFMVGLGSNLLLVRDLAAAQAPAADLLGRSLKLVFASALPLGVAGIALTVLVLPDVRLGAIVAVAVAELVFTPLSDLAMRFHQGLGQFRAMAVVSAAPVLARVAALAAIAVAGGSLDALEWCLLYLLAGAVACAVIWSWLVRVHGGPRWGLGGARALAATGSYLAASNVAIRTTADGDKALMARWAGAHDTGVYAAAHRLVDVVLIPVMAALEAAMPRLFRAGAAGGHGILRLGAQLLSLPLLYACGAAVALYFGAALVPWLLGADYRDGVAVLQWLAGLPPLMCLRYFLRSILLGAGHVPLIGGIDIGGAIVALAISAWLIPQLSWQGAAIAKFASEALMLVAVAAALARARPALRPAAPVAAER